MNRIRTGNDFHVYINPQRDVPKAAFDVHGISTEFLQDKPIFSKIVKQFLEYVGTDSKLVIHNAGFDMNFINYELQVLGHMPIPMHRVTDTLTLARKKFPGAPASLDALCKRFGVSLESRDKHGALIDAELLSHVYLELTGGIQSSLSLVDGDKNIEIQKKIEQHTFPYREFRNTPEQRRLHHDYIVKNLKEALWLKQNNS